jgi:hypothetical protein
MDKDGVKFGVLCMQVPRSADLRKLTIDGPCNFCIEAPGATVDLNTWREVAGTWQLDEIRRADLWVWTTAKSGLLGIQNAENDRLHGRMVNYWISLLMHEPPDLRLPWVLTGHFEAGKPIVSSLVKLIGVFRQQNGIPHQLMIESLEGVAATAGNVDIAEQERIVAGRLERGFAAFVSGMQSDTIDDSILSFVRALEAVLHPNTKEQFCARAAKILQSNTLRERDLAVVLAELYDVRSGLTHAEAIETVFAGRIIEDAVRRGRELRALSYFLASRVYRKVFASQELIRFFSRERGEFWGKVVCGRKPAPFVISVEPKEWEIDPGQRGERVDDGG